MVVFFCSTDQHSHTVSIICSDEKGLRFVRKGSGCSAFRQETKSRFDPTLFQDNAFLHCAWPLSMMSTSEISPGWWLRFPACFHGALEENCLMQNGAETHVLWFNGGNGIRSNESLPNFDMFRSPWRLRSASCGRHNFGQSRHSNSLARASRNNVVWIKRIQEAKASGCADSTASY